MYWGVAIYPLEWLIIENPVTRYASRNFHFSFSTHSHQFSLLTALELHRDTQRFTEEKSHLQIAIGH